MKVKERLTFLHLHTMHRGDGAMMGFGVGLLGSFRVFGKNMSTIGDDGWPDAG